MGLLQIIIASILAIAVNTGTIIVLNKYSVFVKKAAVEAKVDGLKHIRKTKAINIPAVENKEVKGYFVIQLAFSITGKENVSADELVEIYILDEALTKIYGLANGYGTKLERTRIADLTPDILAAVRAKIGNDSVKEILIHEFTYIPRADVR